MGHVERRGVKKQDPETGELAPDARMRAGKAPDWLAVARTPDGGRQTKSFRRKLDAERWLTTVEADKLSGRWVDPAGGETTFGKWVERWQGGLVNLREGSLDRVDGIVRNYLDPRFGRTPLGRLTLSDARAFVAELQASDLAPATVRKVGTVLKQVMMAAVEEGLLATNPLEPLVLPAEEGREMVFLSTEEIANLADAVEPFYAPLVWTAAYSGLRWGELAGLRPDRVDVLRGRITVAEQLVERNGRLTLGPLKTKASRRTVTVPRFLAEMLGERIGEAVTSETALVFPTPAGEPMRRSNFRRRVWTPATREAALEALRFHDLRHTAVALAIAQGAHPAAIKERLGHSSITTTIDRYGHLFPSLDERVAEGLEEAYQQARRDPGSNPRATPRVVEAGPFSP